MGPARNAVRTGKRQISAQFIIQYYDTSKGGAASPTYRYRTSLRLETLKRPDIASFRISRSEASRIYKAQPETLTPSEPTAP